MGRGARGAEWTRGPLGDGLGSGLGGPEEFLGGGFTATSGGNRGLVSLVADPSAGASNSPGEMGFGAVAGAAP